MNSKRFKKVYLEISNICNLQCTFCPEVKREKRQMTGEFLRNALADVRDFAERVCFHVMGEPLGHPEFCEFVDVAREVGAPLEITSNGTLLSDRAQSALLNPTVVQVNFSLQSFVDNFPKADPETYLKNIFSFCRRALAERPDLYVNLRLWNLNDAGGSAERNEAFFHRIEEEFGVSLNRAVDPAFNKSKNITGRLYLHFDSRFEWPDPGKSPRTERGTCHGTRSHVAIHTDGTVVPCCLDKEARIPLGNISETPFSEILQSPRLLAMKRGFEEGRLVEDLCRRCTYIERFE